MRRQAIALVLVALSPVLAPASDRDLPADIATDVESLAARLNESLTRLRRPEALAREVRVIACELRHQSLRCTFRDLPGEPDAKLSEWASRLESEELDAATWRSVRDELTAWLDRFRLCRQVRELIAAQERIGKAIREFPGDYPPHYNQLQREPRLDDLPLIVMKVGETRTVRHGINWRQFPHDTLLVTFVSSDPANLIVAAEKKLDFDNNSTDFQYEVRVGAVGDYVIKLTPEVGDSVLVYVSVK